MVFISCHKYVFLLFYIDKFHCRRLLGMQQSQIGNSSNNPKSQSVNKGKQQNSLADDAGAAAGFLVLGVVLHFFTSNVNIPSWDFFFQVLSYLCYGIGFAGGFFGMSNHSKKDGYADVAVGVLFIFFAYLLHLWVVSLRYNNTSEFIALKILLEIIFGIITFFASFGIFR